MYYWAHRYSMIGLQKGLFLFAEREFGCKLNENRLKLLIENSL